MRVEVGPEVVFHPLARAQDGEAGGEPREPMADGQEEDDADVADQRGVAAMTPERVHGALHRPRNAERARGREHETSDSRQVAPPVAMEIAEEIAERGHPISLAARRGIPPPLRDF